MKQRVFNTKYIFESDSNKSEMPNNVSQSQDSGSSKVGTIITGASVGIGGVAACMAYLYKTYGITNWEQLSKWFKDTIAQNETDGWFATFIKRIIGSIGAAISWANNLVKPLTSGVPYLNSSIAGSQFTYGSVMAMAIIAAAVGAVIWKIYKIIRNRKKPQETTEAFFIRKRFEMMTSLDECDTMFSELAILTEYNITYGKHVALTEWSFNWDWVSNYFVSYKNVKGEDIAQAFSGNTEQLTTSLTTGDSFISRIWDSIQKLYGQVHDIAKNMPMLAKVVIVITALVACWFGIKKYLDSRKKKAQSANNQNNTTTQNTNNAQQNNTNTQNTNNNMQANNNMTTKINAAPSTA